jgi:predicted amidohydrolase
MIIASAQILIVGGDAEGNLLRAKTAVLESSKMGAQIVLLPECSNYGWTDESAITEASEISVDPFIAGMKESAIAHQIYITIGFVERVGSSLYNSAVIISPAGEILLHHRKINELDFARELYSTGNQISSVDTPLGKLGLMICADALSEEDRIIARLIEDGADLILSPSAWAVPPDFDNSLTPYGSLWTDAYSTGLANSKAWVIATSNVGEVRSGEWAGHKCIGNSISMGPNRALLVSPFGESAVHIELINTIQQ